MDPEQMQTAEFVEPQTGDTQVSTDEAQASQEQPESSGPTADQQQRNWRELERSRDEAERRSREYEKQNAEYAQMVKDMVTGKQKADEPDEDDTDIPTLGQTKKTIAREAEKIAKDIVKKTMAEREQAEAPRRLKQEYADFDAVVSKQNIDYLIQQEPELAAILNETKDNYLKGKAAYKQIKRLGLDKKDNVQAMKQDATTNASKPVSPNALKGKNSVGDVNMFAKGLTPELKQQLNQEMIDAIKGY